MKRSRFFSLLIAAVMVMVMTAPGGEAQIWRPKVPKIRKFELPKWEKIKPILGPGIIKAGQTDQTKKNGLLPSPTPKPPINIKKTGSLLEKNHKDLEKWEKKWKKMAEERQKMLRRLTNRNKPLFASSGSKISLAVPREFFNLKTLVIPRDSVDFLEQDEDSLRYTEDYYALYMMGAACGAVEDFEWASRQKIHKASVTIVETQTGIVRTWVNLLKDENDEFVLAEGNEDAFYFPDVLTRPIMYLTLLESGMDENETFYTPVDYRDSLSGIVIKDRLVNAPCELSLKEAVASSDVVMCKALEKRFGNDAGAYAYYLNKTGAWLGDTDSLMTLEDFRNECDTPFEAARVMAEGGTLTSTQMAVWLQGVANGGVMLAPRYNDGDEQKVMARLDCKQENLDRLMAAMRRAVVDGPAKHANSMVAEVSGITAVSQPSPANPNVQCASFGGYFGDYTIVVNLLMDCGEATAEAPAKIARQIIDRILSDDAE